MLLYGKIRHPYTFQMSKIQRSTPFPKTDGVAFSLSSPTGASLNCQVFLRSGSRAEEKKRSGEWRGGDGDGGERGSSAGQEPDARVFPRGHAGARQRPRSVRHVRGARVSGRAGAASRERRSHPQHPLHSAARPHRSLRDVAPEPACHRRKPHQLPLPEYVQELVDADAAGGKVMCAGTRLSPGSWAAALLAAGAALEAMQYVLDGHGLLAYALVRPPGHHAQPTQADGYCFLNNAGLAVQLARDQGCKRVAVVDIDVHYGNGTAEGFYGRDDVYTVSLHMHHGSWGASHPQTGLPDEAGAGAGAGFNMNVPLALGTGDEGYEHAMAELVVPALSQFQPNMIVLAIGQDSSQLDPNGRMCLTMEGYRRIGQIVRELADAFSGGRVLVVQEGGYHITYSAYCAHATLEGLLDLPRPLLADPMGCYPEDLSYSTARIAEIRKKLKGLKKVVE